MSAERELRQLQKAKLKAQQRPLPAPQVAAICNQLGEILASLGRYEEALCEHMEELQLLQEVGDGIGCAVAHRKIGERMAEMGRYQTALQHQQRHLELAQSLDDAAEEQRAWATIGRTHLMAAESLSGTEAQRELKEAEKAFGTSLSVIENRLEGHHPIEELCSMRSRLYLNLGLIYDSLNSARQRQRYLQLSVLLAERAGLWEDLYRAHYNMGHVHYRDGRYGAALRCWDKAKEAIKGHGDIGDMESDCLSSAAQVHLTLGDYRAAKRSYRAAYRLGSSDPKQRRLLRSNLRYATEMVRLQAALEAVGGIQDGGQDGGHDGGKDGGHDGSDGGHDGSQDGGKDGGHDGGHVEGDVGHDGGHIRRDGSHDGSHVGGDGSHDGGHVGGNSSHVGCDVGHDGGHVGGHDGSHVGRDVSHDVSHDVGHVGGDVSHDGGHVGGDVGHDGGHVGVDGGHVGGDVSHDGGHLGRDHSHDGGHIGGDGGHVGGDVGHHGGHVGGDISHDGGHVGCDGGHDGGHVGGDSGHVGGDGGHDGSHVVDPSLAMSLCEQLGDLCAKHGDYNRALTYYQQQLRYAEALSLPGRAVAAIHVSLGATCCDLRRHACAVRHFRSALRLQEGDAKEAADTWFSLALSLLDAGDPAGAEAAFNSAAQWAETAAQPQVKRRALRHLQALQKSHGADNGAGSGADNGASSEEEEEEEEEDEDEGGESSEVELSESDGDEDELEGYPKSVPGRRRQYRWNRRNERGETPLHRACIEGDINRVRGLLAKGHPLNPRDYCGWTPLHEACNHGHLDVAELLLDHGAAIDDAGGPGCEGLTPLHDALACGHFHVAQLLIDRGADVTARSHKGLTPRGTLEEWERLYGAELDQETTELCRVMGQRLKDAEMAALDSLCPPTLEDPNQPPPSPIGSPIGSPMGSPMGSMGSPTPQPARKRPRLHVTPPPGVPSISKSSNVSLVSPQPPALIPMEEFLDDDWLEDDVGGGAKKKRRANGRRGGGAKGGGGPMGGLGGPKRGPMKGVGGLKRGAGGPKGGPMGGLGGPEEGPIGGLGGPKGGVGGPKEGPIGGLGGSKGEPMGGLGGPNEGAGGPMGGLGGPTGGLGGPMGGGHESNEKVPPVAPPALPPIRVRVRVQELVFLIPVPHGCSVSWLCSQAAQRHLQAVGLQPHLALQKDGALLDPTDLVADVLQSGDEVLSEVLNWDLPPLPDRYRRACESLGIAPHPTLSHSSRLQAQQPSFLWVGVRLPPPHFPPLLRALKLQWGLKELTLRGCSMGDPIGPEIGAALQELPQLTLLDLYGNRLGASAIGHIAKAAEKGALKVLSVLDLGLNPLRAESCRPLAAIVRHCPNISALRVRACGFDTRFGSLCRICLQHELRGASQLRCLAISHNPIGTEGLEQLLPCVPNGVTELELGNIGGHRPLDITSLCQYLRELELGNIGGHRPLDVTSLCQYLRELELGNIGGQRPLDVTSLCQYLREERCAVTHLTVAGNRLNGDGVAQLIEAALCRGCVRSVDASANGVVGAVGLRALQAALEGRPHTLRHLNLAGCRLLVPADDALWAKLGGAIEELQIRGATRGEGARKGGQK